MTASLTLPGMESPAQVRLLNFMEQPVRAFVDAGREMWFLAKDVCEILGIANNRDALVDHPENEKLVSVVATSGQGREMLFVNEPGLYRLVFKSRKPQAEAFKTWVFRDVLPSIRRRGCYTAPRSAGFLGLRTGASGRPSLVAAIEKLDLSPLKSSLPPDGLGYVDMLAALSAFAVSKGIPAPAHRTAATLLSRLVASGNIRKTDHTYSVA